MLWNSELTYANTDTQARLGLGSGLALGGRAQARARLGLDISGLDPSLVKTILKNTKTFHIFGNLRKYLVHIMLFFMFILS